MKSSPARRLVQLLAFTCVVGFLSAPVPAAHAAGNSPPVVNSVTISPSPATTDDTLTATVDAVDAVSLRYVWKNGTTVVRDVTKSSGTSADLTDSLDLSMSGNGNKGDTITVEVTPNDGTVDGTAVSASANVANSAPSLTTPSFNPSSPKTTDTLQASTTTSDPDGDNVSVAWVWKVTRGANTCQVKTDSSAPDAAGTRSSSLDLDQPYPTSNCTGESPPADLNPSKKDNVIVEATPSDGTDSGTMESNSVTIADSRPVAKPDGPYVAHGATTLSVSEPGVLANDTDADGDKLTVTAGSPNDGPSHGKLTLNSDGSFSYRPAAGVCNRSDSFTYRAKDGTLRSGQATASITVKTKLRSTTLTLKRSATRIVYGGSVFLKAHLSAFSASARISIYGTPYGGTRKLLARGRPGKRGNLGVHVRPSRLTSYRAFSTDNCFVAGDSGAQRVQVAPLVQGHMVGFFARKSPYALYHAGGRAPHYHGSVTPNHSGRNVTFTWQRMAGGSWTGYLRTTLQLNDNSAVDVYMTKGVVKGVPYRVRIVFLRDADHLSHTGPWSYFKAV